MPSNIIWGSEGMQYANREFQGSTPLGVTMQLLDGQEFVYSKAGGTGLTAGAVQQQAVVISGHDVNLVPTATLAVGETTITLTNSTTAITANQYKEGYLWVNDVDGEGYSYKIKSNLAESTGSGTATFTLEEGSGLRVALTTSSKVGLRVHPTSSVIIAPTAETGSVVGVAVRVVTTLYYCWLQTKGPAAVLTNGSLIVGEGVTRSITTPGAVDPYNGDGTGNMLTIGDVMAVGASTQYSLIDLHIR